MSDRELVEAAGEGIGAEPSVRARAEAEMTRRLKDSMTTSAQRLERLTWVLVVLTGFIAVLTVVLLFRP